MSIINWTPITIEMARRYAHKHGLIRDEVFEKFVENFTSSLPGADVVTYEVFCEALALWTCRTDD